MAKKPDRNLQKKRQENALKKRRKEKAKRKERLRAAIFGEGPARIVRGARRYPLFECLINAEWESSGLAHIVMARNQSEHLVVFGEYLVDIYCLGMKNAFCSASITRSKYREMVARMGAEYEMVSCPVEFAHQVIYGAIDYAAGLRFRPHRDFDLAQWVLEARDAIPPNPSLVFGRDGMPLYASGPYDNVARILAHLDKHVGQGNYHFLIGGPVGESTGIDEAAAYWNGEAEEAFEGDGEEDYPNVVEFRARD